MKVLAVFKNAWKHLWLNLAPVKTDVSIFKVMNAHVTETHTYIWQTDSRNKTLIESVYLKISKEITYLL